MALTCVEIVEMVYSLVLQVFFKADKRQHSNVNIW